MTISETCPKCGAVNTSGISGLTCGVCGAQLPLVRQRGQPITSPINAQSIAMIREDARNGGHGYAVDLCDSHELLRAALDAEKKERAKYEDAWKSAANRADASEARTIKANESILELHDSNAALQSALSEATRREEAWKAWAIHQEGCAWCADDPPAFCSVGQSLYRAARAALPEETSK